MTAIKLFNTASKRLEVFKSLHSDNTVGIYSCGPTVYDYPHIGNLRAYVFVDLLVRVLEKIGGFKVNWAMNITDIDDKTIKAAKSVGVSLQKITRPLEKKFFEELKLMGVQTDKIKTIRATEHFGEMIELLDILKKRGYAYKANDGSWYFSIKKFKEYGKFAGITVKGLKIGARVSQDEYPKDNPADFALWKADQDFPSGRPGWHIECSAMSAKYLGQPFDIHTGGIDLIFPHHQNEIAQTEAATGKPLARFWLHNEHLLVNGQKMAKSLSNVIYLKDLLKDFHPMVIRFFLMFSHYRLKLDFTPMSLIEARESLNSIQRAAWEAKQRRGDSKLIAKFNQALADDLDTPVALAALRSNLNEAGIDFFKNINDLLGLNLRFKGKSVSAKKIEKALKEREKIRMEGDFKKSDQIRRTLEREYVIEILDTVKGPKYYPRY